MREYVCYVGCLKDSMYLVTSEMLPIACKYKGRGCYLGTHPMGGGNTGTRGHGTIHIYIYTYYRLSHVKPLFFMLVTPSFSALPTT